MATVTNLDMAPNALHRLTLKSNSEKVREAQPNQPIRPWGAEHPTFLLPWPRLRRLHDDVFGPHEQRHKNAANSIVGPFLLQVPASPRFRPRHRVRMRAGRFL